MKNVLNANFKLWHGVVIGAILLALTGATVALADTNAVNDLWAAGQVRMFSTFGTDSSIVNVPGNQTVLVQNASITVPVGKKADLQATWTGDIHHNSGTFAYCFGQFTVDVAPPDSKFNPGQYQLIGGQTATEPDAVTVTMTGFKKNIPAGAHTINVYLSGAFSGCEVFDRNLNLVLNLH